MKKIGIIGCGWLGSRLAHALLDLAEIHVTTTTPEKHTPLASKGYRPTVITLGDEGVPSSVRPWSVAPSLDALIVTVSFSERRNSESMLQHRLQHLAAFIGDYKGQLFFMSSTGVYEGMDGEVSEEHMPIEQTIGERLIRSEYPQANILRLAGLMGDDRYLSKYTLKNTDLAVNHVHYADICSVIQAMIHAGLHTQLYNVVAPMHPTKEEVIKTETGEAYTKTEPAKGKRVSPEKMMQALSFKFQHPDPRFFKTQ